MIKKVEMYVVVCDNCNKDCDEDDHCIIAWGDEVQARMVADDAGWFRDGDKNYCPDCYGYDEDNNLVLRTIEQNIQGICQMMISPAAQEIAAKTDEAIPLEDLKQYMTNLLYYAYDEGNKGIDGSQFDKWVEERVGEIREYFKSEKSFKVSEATKEMYPRSFVEWKDMYVQFYAYGNTYEVRSIDKHFVGLDLLFEYWKENKQ